MVIERIERDKAQIAAAVAEAESTTSGEILVCVMRQAGHYGRQEASVGLLVGLLLYAVLWLAYPAWTVQHTWVSLLFGLGLFGGGYLAGLFVPGLPLLLVPPKEKQQRCEERAAIQFQRLHVGSTRAHTGVLIFVAEAERSVVVLGDAPIARRVRPQDWEEVRDVILAGIRSGDAASGIVAGVGIAGTLLATHFPPGSHDRNELANEPLVIR